MTYLFIDGSYFIFYRFNAMLNHYRLKEDRKLSEEEAWNTLGFKEKFANKINEVIYELQKTHNAYQTIIALDRPATWRYNLCDAYKSNRNHSSVIPEIFSFAIETFVSNPMISTVYMDMAEADDVIHVFTRLLMTHSELLKPKILVTGLISNTQYELLEDEASLPQQQQSRRSRYRDIGYSYVLYSEEKLNQLKNNELLQRCEVTVMDKMKVVIIASDKDYIPLLDYTGVQIVTLQNKILELEEGLTGEQYLVAKIIAGDKSDNICSILPRYGWKKSVALAKDPVRLNGLLVGEVLEKYNKNKAMIDNREIPMDLMDKIVGLYNDTIHY